MRADMAKVIVERPRHKGWAWNKPKGYARKLRRLAEDGPPAREGIKRPWRGRTKALNEHLGPLRRYLDSQVGRPWDKVFAEICAHINRNSAVQDHVRDHVKDYVLTQVLIKGGEPCSGEPGYAYGRPLAELYWRQWYVCPRTGLLRRVKSRRKRKGIPRATCAEPKFIRVSDELQCRLIDGAWHLVTLKPLPRSSPASPGLDILLHKPIRVIMPEEAKKQYGAAVYAVAVRRLTRRELRQYPIPIDDWK